MHDAMMARGADQQELLEVLQRDFFRIADAICDNSKGIRQENAAFVAVAILFFRSLAHRRGDSISLLENEKLEQYVQDSIKRLDEFARSDEEALALAKRLAEKLIGTGLNSFEMDLQRQEIEDPKRMFGTDSSTD